MLKNRSIHQLRQIADGYGIANVFSKDANQLIQAIEAKQTDMVRDVSQPIPRPEYDARLMLKPPSKSSDEREVLNLLQGHISKGLHIEFPEVDRWHMKWGVKEDTGNMRVPLRVILDCADRLMK